jgi:hypothetical protein
MKFSSVILLLLASLDVAASIGQARTVRFTLVVQSVE